MGGSNYIPRNAIAFCIWLKELLVYIVAHHRRWGITKFDENFGARAEELQVLADKCTTREHSPVDTLRRNRAQKALEQDVRRYIRGVILFNVHVTDEDRRIMGLPIHDTVPTPIGDPVGLATAMIKYPYEGALELHFEHMDTTPFDKRANTGIRIRYDVIPFSAPLPDGASALYRSAFVRRKKMLFTFNRNEKGHRAVFSFCYENSKGRSGQWSPLISAVIP